MVKQERVLVLDDDEVRLQAFRRALEDMVVVTCKTAKDTIKELEKESFDFIYLDHDLGGKTYAFSGPETGYEVAVWLRDHPEKCPDNIIIHSFNPVGAANMLKILPTRTRYLPGCWVIKE